MKGRAMLHIEHLQVKVEDKIILHNINLDIKPGEVHAIMGPNGSGKSTLANVLAGKDEYEVVRGKILFKNQDLMALSVSDRAREGLFLAFQYPVEIPGVSNLNFLKAAINAKRKHDGREQLDAITFLSWVREKMKDLDMNEALLYRFVNEGFSGGEKKRNEVLQMSLLEPDLAILDETDSGLDIDALQTVGRGVNALRNEKRAILVITHYPRLLEYIVPDKVHVLSKGHIVKSGDAELAHVLEEKGYGWLDQKESQV